MTDSDATKPLGAPAPAPRHEPKPGDRVRILKGEHAGKEGVLCKIHDDPPWGKTYFVTLDQEPWSRSYRWDYIGPVEPPRRMPLLEYLDKLEATAKAAIGSHAEFKFVAPGPVADYFLATQPRATLALIAKLREAVGIARASRELVQNCVALLDTSTADRGDWAKISAAIGPGFDEFMTIEVPE